MAAIGGWWGSAGVGGMKTHLGEHEFGFGYRRPAHAAARRRSVAQILRTAYRKHGRDEHTRLAVKRCLR